MKLKRTKHGLGGEADTPGGILLLTVLVFADAAFRNPLVQVVLTMPVVAVIVWAGR